MLVTSREPQESLYRALVGEDPNPASRIQCIGDCRQPGLIVHAVYSGHEAARALGGMPIESRRDRVLI